jgi:hypothetical protein
MYLHIIQGLPPLHACIQLYDLWANADFVPRPVGLLLILRANVRRSLQLKHLCFLRLDCDQSKVAQRPLDISLLFRFILPLALIPLVLFMACMSK